MRKNNNINDATGKLNELYLAYALGGNTWPNHFRDPGYTPEEVRDVCANTVGHDKYVEILNNTQKMSTVLTGVLVADGLMANVVDVQSVTWTSNPDFPSSPGDHEKLTGIKDINSDADLMIQTISSNTFIGISAKYGSTKDITLRNPGLTTVEAMLGLSNLNTFRDNHLNRMKELGFDGSESENHEKYKSIKGTALAKIAESSSLAYRRDIARVIRDRMAEMSSDEIKDIIIELCAHKTHFPHYRTHTRTRKHDVDHNVSNVVEYTLQRLEEHDNFHVKSDQDSITINVYARNLKMNEEVIMLRIFIKTISGPFKNWVANTSAPFLSDRKPKKKVIHIFDMDDTLFWYNETEASPMVHVYGPDERLVTRLTVAEHESHDLSPGYYFSYNEFKSAEKFFGIANPIPKMIAKLNSLVSSNKDVVIVTARTDFDDRDLFLKKLEISGIPIDYVHVHRSGNIKERYETTAAAKRRMIENIIQDGHYTHVEMWDDSEENLREVLSLSNIKVTARLVSYNTKTGGTTIRKVR